MAAARVPPGGATSVSLGSDDAARMFAERRQAVGAPVETPDATMRFPQAPGGTTTISLGGAGSLGETSVRGPVGGATSVCLGGDSYKEFLEDREKERNTVTGTPEASMRFTQAPGGNSSVCFGAEAPAATEPRGQVGGAATITLGTVTNEERFANECGYGGFEVTPDALPRFTQAPGGTCSVVFGAAAEKAEATKGPVGGTTTINLSDSAAAGDQQALRARGPVGGETTVLLGSADAKQMFGERQQDRTAPVETPDAVARFPHAPGGSSSIQIGHDGAAEEAAAAAASLERRAVGGADTICFGDQHPEAAPVQEVRGPVGGATSVILGQESSAQILREHDQQRSAAIETPEAAPRFTQAPGGTDSVCFGAANDKIHQPRGPVGGASTVVLGQEAPGAAFAKPAAVVETPEAAPRFPQAPGGTSTVKFDSTLQAVPEAVRGPVGGTSTFVLGDGQQTPFVETQEVAMETPAPAPRFPQAPGGSASVVLTDAVQATTTTGSSSSSRVPAGGAASLVIGADSDPDAAKHKLREQAAAVAGTPEAAVRFSQAPGGTASITLGGSDAADDLGTTVRGPVGGADKVVLGSYNDWGNRQTQGPVATPDPSSRFSQAPGGSSTVVLGGHEAPSAAIVSGRVAPGGNATLLLGGEYPSDVLEKAMSSNSFASGAHQNSGNVLTERSSTRLNQAPGGNATIVLGDPNVPFDAPPRAAVVLGEEQASTTEPAVPARPGSATLVLGGGYPDDIAKAKAVSSNAFACGISQNSGNVLTERPSTSVRQAPGGNSTLSLADGTAAATTADPEKTAVISSNKFACGTHQNTGNSITDKSSTKVQQAPGGTSTVCLGAEEITNKTKVEESSTGNTDIAANIVAALGA